MDDTVLNSPPFPPDDIRRFMPLSDERIIRDGDHLLSPLLGRFDMNGLVVDIGCGYGRLAYALDRHGFKGSYAGIDVLGKQISWLQQNFTPVRPSYEFFHFDVHNSRYNPNGKLSSADLRLPNNPSLVILFSVFTHFYADDIKIYLSTISKVMDATSLLCSTIFLLNDEQRKLESEGRSAWPMPHVLDQHTRYHSQEAPLHAIGYDEGTVRSWLSDAGLRVEEILYGSWCGRRNTKAYQDTLLLKKIQ